ncbi:branched-chain amino acid aminotransferase [Kaustia mangrovi]|uniref:Probable branched-chain-amino-acid aminotransferase n=1 Tax=Kaustia mangrovi TaxID=2593653 RepID=A0A7S8C5G3_9HYPH|nr:branched-chain amino acid aminotransferase [Kaustia mangrovi]QPC43751.1 branched-chain amino acid aminotransferase [Kaustia mangrovi]
MAIGKTIATYFDGRWIDGNVPIMRAADHAAWLGTQIFDGARQFEGTTPDLDLHCARLVHSAEVMGMVSPVSAEEIEAQVRKGLDRFARDATLYIRPMMWSCDGGAGVLDLDPESTGFAICIEDMPMPQTGAYSLTVSPYRRPRQDMAVTGAKTGSLYPNNGRILTDARARGFSNALSLDADGNVAETASMNAFAVTDGVVFTPVPNGCFLNGLTRQRVIKLLRADGVEVVETTMSLADFDNADEIFLTGNIAKVMPVNRYQDRALDTGPVTTRARSLYWDFARSTAATM